MLYICFPSFFIPRHGASSVEGRGFGPLDTTLTRQRNPLYAFQRALSSPLLVLHPTPVHLLFLIQPLLFKLYKLILSFPRHGARSVGHPAPPTSSTGWATQCATCVTATGGSFSGGTQSARQTRTGSQPCRWTASPRGAASPSTGCSWTSGTGGASPRMVSRLVQGVVGWRF
jgi:hypothetical protein